MTRAPTSSGVPRLVVAGLAGDSGKSLVSLGLVHAFAARGLRVAAFKKGPDFIDAAWLGAAAGGEGRNLDTFLMSDAALLGSVGRTAASADVIVVEGNRGLYDGVDAHGTHSTAALAKLLRAPVVLVVDVTKATRTIAALVLGVRAFDPDLPLAGVILNRVGTARHERVVRQAVADAVGVPVLGALPRWSDVELPGRHLGLVTPVEHGNVAGLLAGLGGRVAQHTDVDALLHLARGAAPLPLPEVAAAQAVSEPPKGSRRPRIGALRDAAFSFYYAENIEALEHAGAEIVWVDSFEARELPAIHALYAGGGFPEVHVERLTANQTLRHELRRRVEQGLPVWAECGGLGYLAQTMVVDGQSYDMVGALPIVVEMHPKPVGHGYVEAVVDRDNPFLPVGTRLRGHEFHYTGVLGGAEGLQTAMALERGTGVGNHRDAICSHSVVACYTHLHALGCPEWAVAMVSAAQRFAAAQPEDPALATSPPHAARPHGAPRGASRPAKASRRVGGISVGARGGKALADAVRSALASGDLDAIEPLLASEPRVVRHLLAASYQPDVEMRRRAGRALAIAGRHHQRTVQNAVRRLVWAMNDESGTNATHAPDVLREIAELEPELLLPVVPDLVRLTADEGLREGLACTLRLVAQGCPGRVGAAVSQAAAGPKCRGGQGGVATSP